MAALSEANRGHTMAYGNDPWTEQLNDKIVELFGPSARGFPVWGGTGANVMALASMLGPAHAVLCTNWAHINVDETGAPERVLGAKLIDVACADGKLTVEHIEEQAHAIGQVHHAQPSVVSITQSTELGTLYSIEEITALCTAAHRHGMGVHLDGARIANAVVACSPTPGAGLETLRAMTADAGVDVLSFGTTKNGAMYGEVVVYLNDRYVTSAPFVRKMVTQLPSKMRYVSAQVNALLDGGLWLDLAAHSNAMAQLLFERTRSIADVEFDTGPVVNSVFPRLPAAAIDPLREWCFFWDWDRPRRQVRWMTAWDTTVDDVESFATGVRELLSKS